MNGRGRLFAGRSRGQALIYVGLIMSALLAFVALVTDGGMLWYNQRLMQNAVDAAALAGAQNLPMPPNDSLGARPVACTYTGQNSSGPNYNFVRAMVVSCAPQAAAGTVGCDKNSNPAVDILVCQTYVANDTVRVTAHKAFHPLIGASFGWATVNLTTRAIAVVGSIKSACIVPLFQTQDTMDPAVWNAGNGVILNQLTKLKVKDTTSGNSLALQANGSSSANDWAAAMADVNRCLGDTPPQTSGTAVTNPGGMVGKLDDAIGPRVSQSNVGLCPNADITPYKRTDGSLWNGNTLLTPKNCGRMIVIPLLGGSINDYAGSKPGPIRGFLTFYITDWCGNTHCPATGLQKGEISGYFVRFIAAGDTDFQGYDGFGTKIVALIG